MSHPTSLFFIFLLFLFFSCQSFYLKSGSSTLSIPLTAIFWHLIEFLTFLIIVCQPSATFYKINCILNNNRQFDSHSIMLSPLHVNNLPLAFPFQEYVSFCHWIYLPETVFSSFSSFFFLCCRAFPPVHQLLLLKTKFHMCLKNCRNVGGLGTFVLLMVAIGTQSKFSSCSLTGVCKSYTIEHNPA